MDGGLLQESLRLLLGRDPAVTSAIATTLVVATTSLAACLAVGVPMGFCLGYYRFPGRRTIRLLVDTALALPTVFIGLLVYFLLSRSGPLGQYHLLFTRPAIVAGQVLLGLPIVTALTAAQVEALDDRLDESLRGLGATGWQLLRAAAWQVRYGLLAAAVTAYGRLLTEVGVSMMVGGNIKYHTRTITTAIALETGKGEFLTGMALGLVLLFLALLVNAVLWGIRCRWAR